MLFFNPDLGIWKTFEEVQVLFPHDTNLYKINSSYTQMSIHGWYSERYISEACVAVDPDGNEHPCLPNIRQFAISRGLCPNSFRRMCTGKYNSHKGWTFARNRPGRYKRAGDGCSRNNLKVLEEVTGRAEHGTVAKSSNIATAP